MIGKIHIFISIIAAIVVTVVSLVQETPIDIVLKRTVIVIILFYIIGLIVRSYLRKNVFYKEDKGNLEEDIPSDSRYRIENEDLDNITNDEKNMETEEEVNDEDNFFNKKVKEEKDLTKNDDEALTQ